MLDRGLYFVQFLGCFYLWGSIVVYVASYMHQFDNNVTIPLMNVVFPVMCVSQNLMMPVGAKFQKILNPSL